jgi:hypothetical protein
MHAPFAPQDKILPTISDQSVKTRDWRGADSAPRGGTRMRDTKRWLLPAAALIAAAVAIGFWYHEHDALEALHAQIQSDELQPILMLLKENQALIQQLKSAPFTDNGSGILESYLAKIRGDGVGKHSDMKQKLDTLAENNTAIVTLIKAYAPHAKTPAFISEADKFRNYASAWHDRWNSVMELFMAGGNYPASGISFPIAFPNALDAEIVAARL